MERQTIDQEFRDSYDERGMQPTGIHRSPVRNPEVTYQTRSAPHPPRRPARNRVRSSGTSGVNKQQKRAARVGVGRVNLTAWAIGGSTWFFIQLPMAAISFIGFMATGAAATLATYVTYSGDNAVLQGLQGALSFVTTGYFGLLNAASKELLNFDFAEVNPISFFLITYYVILGYMFILFFSLYLLYKLMGAEPFFGQGSGLKIGTFYLAIIGYSFPIINLLPWFIPWTIAVWKYPK